MSEKRVVAYFMHEHEEAACKRHFKPGAQWSAGYGVGRVEEEDIERLEAEGVVVEVLDEPAAPGGGGFALADEEAAAAAAAPPGVGALAGLPRAPQLHPTKDNVFAIEIDGPFLVPAWREELAGLGVEILERLPSGPFTAYLSLGQVPRVRALPFVRSVRLFASQHSPSAVFTEGGPAEAAALADEEETLRFDVLLHRPEDMDDVRAWMDEHDVPIVASGTRKLRVELGSESELARDIEALPEVRRVAQYVEPTLANQVARRLLGLDPDPADNPGHDDHDPANGPLFEQTGDGEIVAVADSGLDAEHPDFAGRIVEVIPRARPDGTDLHGHGTHVAGSALGDGSASGGAHRGTAPGARLLFQSIMDHAERLSGLPVELGELFEEAYAKGARIHNNSWSAHTKSFYTFNALEVDQYVADHPDLLVTIAAGNEGSAADPFSSEVGFVDWQSIGSPATAKNALTVGASRSSRSESRRGTQRYRQFNGRRFPDPPIANETVSGDPECLAAFSARGPCDPRRIKPDLVAPGTDVVSARASTAPESSFWGLLPDDDRYGYMGGTSMATPLVSGCAALVREYYRKARGHEPSAALVKATLINSTRRLGGRDAIADHDKLPNYHQGFGAVHMPYAIPNAREPWMGLRFVDTWKGDGGFAHGGLQRTRLAFEVRGGAFLRVCLAWTDPAAGASLQNVLGVILEHQDLDPRKRFGNADGPNAVGPLDRDNNVQIIRVEDPPPGNYLLQVFAANLLAPQEWALVVAGDLEGDLTEV